jgi:hypothetical protein
MNKSQPNNLDDSPELVTPPKKWDVLSVNFFRKNKTLS